MQHSHSCSLPESFLNPQVQIPRCRICYDQAKTLMKLCQCSGSIAYVHQTCIIEWIEKRIVCEQNMISDIIPTPKCQICKFDYSAKIKIGREQISTELLWDNIKKLTTFNTLFTILCMVIYFVVFILMMHWVWISYLELSSKNQNAQNVCMVDQQNELDVYSIAKYALVWGIFPLHYLYSSIKHLKMMKRIIIDGSKQIIADVILLPKQVLKPKCLEIN